MNPYRRKTWRPGGFQDTKAVIDIGSNSIKLRVVRKQGFLLRTLMDTTEVVRLGMGLEKGLIDEETMRHGVDVVRRLVRLAGELGARPRLVGTMALRTARNAGDFVRRVRERTGISVEVLSGEEEARLAWLGAIHALGAREGAAAVFDTGGGSTEFIFGVGSRIRKSRSIAVGAVCLTEKFFDAPPGPEAPVRPEAPARLEAPVNPEALDSARRYVRECFALEELSRTPPLSVIGLGGGVVAMASVKLGLASLVPDKIDGTLLTRKDVDAQVELYARSSLEERKKIVGLPPKRADIILASACIVQCALEALKTESFRVSINGLRHGLLVEMFGGRK